MMKKNIILVIVIFFFSSCMRSALSKRGIYDDHAQLVKLEYSGKEIYLLPMHHIGTRNFYKEVKNKVDSLQNSGYVVFYEKVSQGRDINDTIHLKFRKLIGKKTKGGYLDTLNNSINGIKFKALENLMNQPSYTRLGLDSLTSKNIDISKVELIQEYEKRYGEIILDQCDYETAINEPYYCKKIKNKNNWNKEIILDYRNQRVVDSIKGRDYKKILIIYGSNHLEGIKSLLNTQ